MEVSKRLNCIQHSEFTWYISEIVIELVINKHLRPSDIM